VESNLKNAKDMTEFCVDYGTELGCTYVEARYINQRSRGFAYRNGEPMAGGFQPSEGIGVRILADGGMGFASFDRMDKDLAQQAIEAAYKMGKNANRKEPIDFGEPVDTEAKWSVDVNQRVSDVDNDTIMEVCNDLNEQMEGLSKYTLMMTPTEYDKYLVTSEGCKISAFKSFILISAILTAKAKVGTEQKWFDLTKCGGWERIEETNLVDDLKDKVKRLKRAAQEAEEVPELMEKEIDMVVGHEVAGIIAHENVGHPSEGDRIMGREGAQAGESFWRDLDIGESRVGSEVVNVSEDPTIPNTGGYYLYDDEGVKARKRKLIKDGIANEPLLNREFGVKFGMGSNGAARCSGFNREPIIRMSNTYFEPGDHSFEELFEDVDLGVYMRSFAEWNIDDRRYQSKYKGSEAYLIKDGELTDTMVKRPVLETTSVGLLSSVDAVSDKLSLDFPGTCGKSDPMQGVPIYAGGGQIRFRNIRLGGVG